MKMKSANTSRFGHLLDLLASLVIQVAGICLVVLVFSFAWLVFGRYVMNQTPTWVEQMSLLLVTTITFLAAAVGIHERTHLNVDVLSHFLPERGRLILSILVDMLLAVFGAALAWYGWDLAQFAWHKRIPLLGISEGIRYLPMSVSGVLIVLFEVGRIYQALSTLSGCRGRTSGKGVSTMVEEC